MKRIAYFLLIVVLLALAACSSGESEKQGLIPPEGPSNSSLAGAADTAPAAIATVPPLCSGAQNTNTASFATEVIRLVNVERSKAGLGALTSNTALTQAAQKHSIDMGCNFFLSHTGSDGSSPFDRMEDFGYYYYWAGENVAAGYPTPADVVTGWMNSQAHRDNILYPTFVDIGIGYVYNPGDTTGFKHYWTMTLGEE